MEILCSVKDVNTQKIVTLERFGLLLKWFGPLTHKNKNIIDKIFNIIKEKWFHGEISRDRLSSLISRQSDEIKSKKIKGDVFLVRFSESEPIEEHPFSITVITKSGSLSHRINYELETGMYSVNLQKNDEVVTTSNSDLISLMNTFFISKQSGLKLKKEKGITSDLYWSVFSEETGIVYKTYNDEKVEDDSSSN